MTAKELLLRRAPGWTEAQAAAALRVVEAQTELGAFLDAEATLSVDELAEVEDRWAQSSALEAIRDEPW